MNNLKNGIPYCAGCSRKAKRTDLKANEYFCPIVADTPMKGIVSGDIDGTKCVELGVYIPIERANAKEQVK